MRQISKSLQETLLMHPEHKKVYFDIMGNFYFNAFLLKKSKDDTDPPELYGAGIHSHREVIDSLYNVDKRTTQIAKGDPLTKIVEILKREEILSANPKVEGNNIAQQLALLSDNDKATALAQLGMTPDVIDALKKFKELQSVAMVESPSTATTPSDTVVTPTATIVDAGKTKK